LPEAPKCRLDLDPGWALELHCEPVGGLDAAQVVGRVDANVIAFGPSETSTTRE